LPWCDLDPVIRKNLNNGLGVALFCFKGEEDTTSNSDLDRRIAITTHFYSYLFFNSIEFTLS
jgi:hypothetical protein